MRGLVVLVVTLAYVGLPLVMAEDPVLFMVMDPLGNTVKGNVVFSSILLGNKGNDYDITTGNFTAPVTGLYHFEMSFYATGSGWCSLTTHPIVEYSNPSPFATAEVFSDSAINGKRQATASAYIKLAKDDKVSVGSCRIFDFNENGNKEIITYNNFQFGGALIKAI